MKNKFNNKFNNIFNNKFIKFISILILLSITLYLSFSELSYKENFNSKYTNLCKNKPTNFYLSNESMSSMPIMPINPLVADASSCEYKCSNTDTCNLYIYDTITGNNDTITGNNDTCKLYNITPRIDINCDKNILDDSIERNGTYIGKGLVNKKYYDENSNDFSYNNFLLDKALELKTQFNEFKRIVPQSDKNVDNVYYSFIDTNIIPIIDKIRIHLDLSTNLSIPATLNLSSDHKFNFDNINIILDDLYAIFYNLSDQETKNETQKINSNLEFSKNSFIYIILAIILIITILLVVLYKLFPNSLNEFTLLIYFISIIFIVFFIHILI